MKIWIINNTKFGYKNNSKEWSKNMLSYFDDYFIPFITKHSKPGDRLVHLGNIFNSSETISISLLLSVKNIFEKISKIIPITFVDGHKDKSGISSLFTSEEIKNDDISFLPYNVKILDQINQQKIIFLNSMINSEILKKFPDTLFFCGFHDDRLESDNVICVGSPYQFDNTTPDKGFYVLDTTTSKYKFIKNSHSPTYNTITITDISQIDEIDEDFVNNNKVSVVVDKALLEDKKIKISVLLSKFNFKSVTYKNDVEEVEEIDSDSMNMEDLIREKIKNSDNPDLMSEFENIMNIYKERY